MLTKQITNDIIQSKVVICLNKFETGEKIGNIFKNARIDKKLSQIDCARNCGVSVVAYQYWERGVCVPKEDNLKRLCNFLEIDIGEVKCIMEG